MKTRRTTLAAFAAIGLTGSTYAQEQEQPQIVDRAVGVDGDALLKYSIEIGSGR